MKPEVLALSINQFHKLCSEFAAPDQQHTDDRKNKFKKSLFELSRFFINLSVHHLTESGKAISDHDMKLFWGWAAALDSKNGYTLSRETRGLLDNLCKLWIPDSDKYIFAATDGDFGMIRYSSEWGVLAESIRKAYKVEFQNYLITFFIPKHLKDDYLFIGTVYHEFGHFYVEYNNLPDIVAQKVKDEIDDGKPFANELLTVWFEAIELAKDAAGNIDVKKRDAIIDSQTEEYMADLFGAQYLGEHLTAHIESNRQGRMDVKSESHPTPIRRNQLIAEFYDYDNHKDNQFLNWIIEAFNGEVNHLQKRFLPLDPAPLYAGKEISISTDEELHSLFHLAWDVYLQQMAPRYDAAGNVISQPIDHNVYLSINEAVRKSIVTYLEV